MIKNLLTIFAFFVYFTSNGQVVDNFCQQDGSNIYNQTLIQFIKNLEKENKKIPDTLFIEQDEKLTDNLISQIGQTRVKVIQLEKVDKNKLSQEEKFISYKLYPVEYINQEFRVPLIPYTSWYNENHQLMSIDNIRYWAAYDFKEGKFIFKQMVSWKK